MERQDSSVFREPAYLDFARDFEEQPQYRKPAWGPRHSPDLMVLVSGKVTNKQAAALAGFARENGIFIRSAT